LRSATDKRELLADPDVELVDVCVAAHTHRQQYSDAIDAGKHVVCEKPPAGNTADAFGRPQERLAPRRSSATASHGVDLMRWFGGEFRAVWREHARKACRKSRMSRPAEIRVIEIRVWRLERRGHRAPHSCDPITSRGSRSLPNKSFLAFADELAITTPHDGTSE
jgi:hypothetical protein